MDKVWSWRNAWKSQNTVLCRFEGLESTIGVSSKLTGQRMMLWVNHRSAHGSFESTIRVSSKLTAQHTPTYGRPLVRKLSFLSYFQCLKFCYFWLVLSVTIYRSQNTFIYQHLLIWVQVFKETRKSEKGAQDSSSSSSTFHNSSSANNYFWCGSWSSKGDKVRSCDRRIQFELKLVAGSFLNKTVRVLSSKTGLCLGVFGRIASSIFNWAKVIEKRKSSSV